MNWVNRYTAPNESLWQGRPDLPPDSCFFQVMQFLSLPSLKTAPATRAFALLGFACDEGISRNHGRSGAAAGPNAIRECLARLPVNRPGLLCYDAGNITCPDHDLESAQLALGEAVAALLSRGYVPILLGGGHEIAWGHYLGIAKTTQGNLGIINFDAHFDMRPLQANRATSGTPFLQIAEARRNARQNVAYTCIGIQPAGNIPLLFDTAKEYGVHYLLAEEIDVKEKLQTLLDNCINHNDQLYVSTCLDVFASFVAPGVSAPQSLGVMPQQIIPVLRTLAASGKVISYDIAEFSPRYDIDARTAKLAATLIYEIIHHHRDRHHE